MSRIIDLDNLLVNPLDIADNVARTEQQNQIADSVYNKLRQVMEDFNAEGATKQHTSVIVERLLAKLTPEEATTLLFKGIGDHVNGIHEALTLRAMLLN